MPKWLDESMYSYGFKASPHRLLLSEKEDKVPFQERKLANTSLSKRTNLVSPIAGKLPFCVSWCVAFLPIKLNLIIGCGTFSSTTDLDMDVDTWRMLVPGMIKEKIAWECCSLEWINCYVNPNSMKNTWLDVGWRKTAIENILWTAEKFKCELQISSYLIRFNVFIMMIVLWSRRRIFSFIGNRRTSFGGAMSWFLQLTFWLFIKVNMW